MNANDTVLVIGLGRSGLAAVDVLRERGASVFAVDEKPAGELREPLERIAAQGAQFVVPADLAAVLPTVTCAILSPGIPLNGALVRRIQQSNVPVYSEIELAYRLCAAPIAAVTGTKGKSTTTALLGHLLRECGRNVRVGGNIGNPLLYEAVAAQQNGWVVAEVSSFQLESIRSFRPRIAVILNISSDHLDRYHSMEEYAEAKYRIFANQSESDFFVGNLDDERLRELHWHTGEARVHARQLWFTLEDEHAHASMYLRGETIVFTPFSGDPRPIDIARTTDVPLPGRHNVQNAMAALLAALAAGGEATALRQALCTFAPMPHRLQVVATIDGVRYIDDSKATNPGAVIAALHAYESPIVLIAGGRSKNADFSELGRAIDERAVALVVIGEAAQELSGYVNRVPVHRAASLKQAVRIARDQTPPGGIVLLSPACASFDMFDSAEDRGNRFTDAVHELRADTESSAVS